MRIPCIAAFLVAVPVQFVCPASSKTEHPNIVIFLSDDMGWNDVGYHGSEIETPHIDKLVTEGIELERFYSFQICSPTRAALMTGRSPLRFGITSPLSRAQTGLPLDEHLLPQTFRAAGYQTFMTGKWHLGSTDDRYLPHRRGFDHFYGFVGGFIDSYRHTSPRGDGSRPDWQRNGKTVREEGYATDLLVDEAIRLLRERDKTRPVLLYVPFGAPHTPLQAPESFIAKYKNIENPDRRAYAAMVDAMDAAIGRVLAAIDTEGLRDNTLVLFFNDNGGAVGRGSGSSNHPFKGGKGGVFEGGIHVAAVMRWPGVLEAGGKRRQVISVLDVLPTLAAAAGIEAGNTKPLDGRNLWAEIRDGRDVPREGLVIGSGRNMAVFEGPWKLVQSRGGRGRPPGLQLYRIADDPLENRDLAAENAEIVSRLTARSDEFAKLLAASGGANAGRGPSGGRRSRRPTNLFVSTLDTDGDGTLSAAEISEAPAVLLKLDRNGDGKLTPEELPSPRRALGRGPFGRGPRR